jgi:hypothetical protein
VWLEWTFIDRLRKWRSSMREASYMNVALNLSEIASSNLPGPCGRTMKS